jgi:hypothetical protein
MIAHAISPRAAFVSRIEASISERAERERHGGRCGCIRCAATRALERAEIGEEVSILDVDPGDPAFVAAFEYARKHIAAERARINRNAAALLAIEMLRGRVNDRN